VNFPWRALPYILIGFVMFLAAYLFFDRDAFDPKYDEARGEVYEREHR